MTYLDYGTTTETDASGNILGSFRPVDWVGEKFRKLHTQYHQAEEGECFLLFNSLNLLEIGIYKGNIIYFMRK